MSTKAPAIHEIVCQKCGEDVSGPDLDSVKEAAERHQRKAHPKKVSKK